MAERKISEKSLENLKRFNQENNAITRESIEISLLQLLEKKDLKKITISELVRQFMIFWKNEMVRLQMALAAISILSGAPPSSLSSPNGSRMA